MGFVANIDCSVGVDNIDVPAATAQGVIVVNSPAGNIVAAAEHTITLLLATARNVGRADASVKEGKWERSKLVGIEVSKKILGIVGTSLNPVPPITSITPKI